MRQFAEACYRCRSGLLDPAHILRLIRSARLLGLVRLLELLEPLEALRLGLARHQRRHLRRQGMRSSWWVGHGRWAGSRARCVAGCATAQWRTESGIGRRLASEELPRTHGATSSASVHPPFKPLPTCFNAVASTVPAPQPSNSSCSPTDLSPAVLHILAHLLQRLHQSKLLLLAPLPAGRRHNRCCARRACCCRGRRGAGGGGCCCCAGLQQCCCLSLEVHLRSSNNRSCVVVW